MPLHVYVGVGGLRVCGGCGCVWVRAACVWLCMCALVCDRGMWVGGGEGYVVCEDGWRWVMRVCEGCMLMGGGVGAWEGCMWVGGGGDAGGVSVYVGAYMMCVRVKPLEMIAATKTALFFSFLLLLSLLPLPWTTLTAFPGKPLTQTDSAHTQQSLNHCGGTNTLFFPLFLFL